MIHVANEALVHMITDRLVENETITNQQLDFSKLTNPGYQYSDIFKYIAIAYDMTNYDVYTNMHYNIIKYTKYIVEVDQSLFTDLDKKKFSDVCFDFFIILAKPFEQLTNDQVSDLRSFICKIEQYNRNKLAATNLSQLFFNPSIHTKLKKIINVDLQEDIGFMPNLQ